MKNLKITLTALGISLLSINTFAQDYIYKGVKNVEATIGINNDESDSGQETVSADCYDPANIGKRIQAQGCKGLLIVDNDSLRQMVLNDENYADTNIFTGQVTDMYGLFCKLDPTVFTFCTDKNVLYLISNWDTSNVSNISFLFLGQIDFNQNINNWNTSNVRKMNKTFAQTENFNQPLNNWDVSNVKKMSGTFQGADSFNQPLDNWDVSNVDNMYEIFHLAQQFHQNISNWCSFFINSKPIRFDLNSGFEGKILLQPNWETCH